MTSTADSLDPLLTLASRADAAALPATGAHRPFRAPVPPDHRPPGVTAPLAWPDARTMFEGAFRVDAARALKYRLRRIATHAVRQRLLAHVEREPATRALFLRAPRVFYPVMNHLLDRRLDAQARCDALLSSLVEMRRAAGTPARWQALLDDGLALGTLPEGHGVVLSLNTVSYHEGTWQLALVDADGRRLYSLGFGWTAVGELLVANVQGPAADGEGLARVRAATAAAQGLRPPHLLLHLMRLLARTWGAHALQGIDPDWHVKGRWNVRADRLRFDYRAFWAETGGESTPAGRWTLPLSVPPRPLEDVPSRRRAMYRRRADLLAALDAQVRAAVGAEAVTPAR